MDKLKETEKIGCGRIWDAYKGYNSVTNEAVILKKSRLPEDGEGVPVKLLREISYLTEIKHNNILRLLDIVVVEEGKSVYLAYEHMDLDLKKFMETPEIAMHPDLIKRFLLQILRGVAYYHSRKVFLQHLKPQNLLIESTNNILKLADHEKFGDSPETYGEEDVSPSYKAPEVLLHCKQCSLPVDMWSVGCIFAEMVIQQPLFFGHSDEEHLTNIFSIMGTPNEENWPGVTSSCPSVAGFPKSNPKDLAEVVPGLEPAGIDLLSKMLCLNPSGRPRALDALKHAYLHNVDLLKV